jgi:energy-converting hydrogenase Eha subunit E
MNPRLLARAQGIFYAASGVWPVVHLRSFEWVTGPKADDWLVKTVGLTITAIGVPLLLAGRNDRVTPELGMVAAGAAGGLAAIDVVYVARGRISPIYLLDAVVEVGLVAAWVASRGRLAR